MSAGVPHNLADIFLVRVCRGMIAAVVAGAALGVCCVYAIITALLACGHADARPFAAALAKYAGTAVAVTSAIAEAARQLGGLPVVPAMVAEVLVAALAAATALVAHKAIRRAEQVEEARHKSQELQRKLEEAELALHREHQLREHETAAVRAQAEGQSAEYFRLLEENKRLQDMLTAKSAGAKKRD